MIHIKYKVAICIIFFDTCLVPVQAQAREWYTSLL